MFSSSSHRRLRTVTVLLAGLTGVAACPPAMGGPQPTEAAPADAEGDCQGPLDLWVASTRRLPGIRALPTDVTCDVEQLVDDGRCRRWKAADLELLLAAPGRPLVIFVHGNRYEPADARSQGLLLARRLAECRPAAPAPRVVIFSWPSQKQGLLLKDGRRKYDRAHADGHYLAWLLGRLEPERPVALVGYSFGALVAAEALRDLEGLAPGGVAWSERPGRTQLVLVAPALRCDAVAPGGPFRDAVAGLDRLTLLINSRDEALRFFPLLEPDVQQPALGHVGMPRRWLPAGLEYDAADAAGVVGKLHTLVRYLDSRSLAERIAGGALDGLDGE